MQKKRNITATAIVNLVRYACWGRKKGDVAMGKYSSTEERLWSTALSSLVAAIPALMIGYTFAYPSSALLDLTEDNAGLPEDYRFSVLLADIFAVSFRH